MVIELHSPKKENVRYDKWCYKNKRVRKWVEVRWKKNESVNCLKLQSSLRKLNEIDEYVITEGI